MGVAEGVAEEKGGMYLRPPSTCPLGRIGLTPNPVGGGGGAGRVGLIAPVVVTAGLDLDLGLETCPDASHSQTNPRGAPEKGGLRQRGRGRTELGACRGYRQTLPNQPRSDPSPVAADRSVFVKLVVGIGPSLARPQTSEIAANSS